MGSVGFRILLAPSRAPGRGPVPAGSEGEEGLGDREVRRLRYDEPDARATLAAALAAVLAARHRPDEEQLVVLCIGTDRSTGDALGPLVGERLAPLVAGRAAVYGTLDEPVHASNLPETLERLRARHPRPFTVAVDACLGRVDSVGTISVGAGPLQPGAGVNKALPEVGQAYVTGTVNVAGFMEYFVLQNTRLSLVMRMAEVIGDGLARALAALPMAGARPAASLAYVLR
jgi:putative sporulation protein YyaC